MALACHCLAGARAASDALLDRSTTRKISTGVVLAWWLPESKAETRPGASLCQKERRVRGELLPERRLRRHSRFGCPVNPRLLQLLVPHLKDERDKVPTS